MEINELIALIDQKSRESGLTKLASFLSMRERLAESDLDYDLELHKLPLRYFFHGIAEDFASHQWIETSNYSRLVFTGDVKALQQKIAYYLEVGTDLDKVLREIFDNLILCYNFDEIKRLIYREFERLQAKLRSFNPKAATRKQILSIKKTLEEIVELAG